MRAGRLDRRIVIQQLTETRDADGYPVKSWSTFATVWAGKRDIRGRERVEADQPVAAEATVFFLRYLAGVSAAMRIVHDGKTYGITGIAEIGRREGLEISAAATGLLEVPA